MTVTITGGSLTLSEVMRVARGQEPVDLHPDVAARMAAGRAVVEEIVAAGSPVYGLTTGVAARKRHRLAPEDQPEHNRLMIDSLFIGQGPPAPEDVVRATILLLTNGFASGRAGVRPLLVDRLVAALNDGEAVSVGIHGSLGMADLAPMAELARAVLGDLELAAKEAVSLVDNNAFSTAIAALAIHDLERLLDAFDAAAALDLEAFGANLSILHPAAAAARPYPGVEHAIGRLRTLLAGSSLWVEGGARNLQDPLSFRCIPQVHGAAREALAYGQRQLEIELNASQENPLIVLEEQKIISVGNFDPIILAAALDFLRLALAPVVTSAANGWSSSCRHLCPGSRRGCLDRPDFATTDFPQFAYVAAAITGEARSLAAPVSYELSTTSIAEGIEDRVTLAPLAGRRLSEMVELGERVAAIELAVAAQAIRLRQPPSLGSGTAAVLASVRNAAGRGEHPADVRPLVELIRSGFPGLDRQSSATVSSRQLW